MIGYVLTKTVQAHRLLRGTALGISLFFLISLLYPHTVRAAEDVVEAKREKSRESKNYEGIKPPDERAITGGAKLDLGGNSTDTPSSSEPFHQASSSIQSQDGSVKFEASNTLGSSASTKQSSAQISHDRIDIQGERTKSKMAVDNSMSLTVKDALGTSTTKLDSSAGVKTGVQGLIRLNEEGLTGQVKGGGSAGVKTELTTSNTLNILGHDVVSIDVTGGAGFGAAAEVDLVARATTDEIKFGVKGSLGAAVTGTLGADVAVNLNEVGKLVKEQLGIPSDIDSRRDIKITPEQMAQAEKAYEARLKLKEFNEKNLEVLKQLAEKYPALAKQIEDIIKNTKPRQDPNKNEPADKKGPKNQKGATDKSAQDGKSGSPDQGDKGPPWNKLDVAKPPPPPPPPPDPKEEKRRREREERERKEKEQKEREEKERKERERKKKEEGFIPNPYGTDGPGRWASRTPQKPMFADFNAMKPNGSTTTAKIDKDSNNTNRTEGSESQGSSPTGSDSTAKTDSSSTLPLELPQPLQGGPQDGFDQVPNVRETAARNYARVDHNLNTGSLIMRDLNGNILGVAQEGNVDLRDLDMEDRVEKFSRMNADELKQAIRNSQEQIDRAQSDMIGTASEIHIAEEKLGKLEEQKQNATRLGLDTSNINRNIEQVKNEIKSAEYRVQDASDRAENARRNMQAANQQLSELKQSKGERLESKTQHSTSSPNQNVSSNFAAFDALKGGGLQMLGSTTPTAALDASPQSRDMNVGTEAKSNSGADSPKAEYDY